MGLQSPVADVYKLSVGPGLVPDEVLHLSQQLVGLEAGLVYLKGQSIKTTTSGQTGPYCYYIYFCKYVKRFYPIDNNVHVYILNCIVFLQQLNKLNLFYSILF